MHPPRVRLKLRTALTLIALIALAMGSSIMVLRRRTRYQERAAGHSLKERNFAEEAQQAGRFWFQGTPLEVARLERRSAYHGRLKRKYEDAAARPWIDAGPDPAPPDS